MGVTFEAIAHIVDWRFAAGIVVGFIFTLRYVVVGVYHPMIREMQDRQKPQDQDYSGKLGEEKEP